MASCSPTHLCRHRNKYKRSGERFYGLCEHRIRDDSGFRYCEDHRDWHEGWYQLTHVLPAVSGSDYDAPSWSAQQERPLSYLQTQRMQAGASYARTWTDSNAWRSATAETIREAVGERYYKRARRRGTRRMCKQLEREAEALLAAKKHAEDILADLLQRGLTWIIAPRPLASTIAAKLAEKMVEAAGGAKLATVATALRCFGIFICAVDDSVSLEDCYCLRPLAKDQVTSIMQDKVKEVLQHGFDQLREGRSAAA